MYDWFELEIDEGAEGFMVCGEHEYTPTNYGEYGEPTDFEDSWKDVAVAKYDEQAQDYVDLPEAEAQSFFEAHKEQVLQHIADEAESAAEAAYEAQWE